MVSHHLEGILVSFYLVPQAPKPKDVRRVTTVLNSHIAAPDTSCSVPGAQTEPAAAPPTHLSLLPLGIHCLSYSCRSQVPLRGRGLSLRVPPSHLPIAQCQCQFTMGTAPCQETLEDAHTRSCLSCLVILPLLGPKVTVVTVGAGRHTQR